MVKEFLNSSQSKDGSSKSETAPSKLSIKYLQCGTRILTALRLNQKWVGLELIAHVRVQAMGGGVAD